MMTASRYALYFAPSPQTPLHRFGSCWLGRDADTGSALAQPDVPGLPAKRLADLTASARRYGFHATLKPPFALADGFEAEDLMAAVADFCRNRAPVVVPQIELAALGRFLALVPEGRPEALHRLADDCVRDFDRFRRPPVEGELARRRKARLTEVHEQMLLKWGYPYVMEEFRFHMTLTDRLAPPERALIEPMLLQLTRAFRQHELVIDSLAVFGESEPGGPFQVVRRFKLEA